MTSTVERGDRPRANLDDQSRRIVEYLQTDGRRSYAAIGRAVQLSEAAVRQRVRRLLAQGVMRIVAVTDPLMFGLRRQAMIGIKADGDIESIADRLAALPQVERVVISAGSFDILIELLCQDDEQLISIVNNEVRKIDGVRGLETFVYLRLAKQSSSVATRS